MPYVALLHTHKWSVILFLVLYLVKTVLLLNNSSSLDKMTRWTKIPEMVISFAFLLSGIGMLINAALIDAWLLAKIAMVLASIPLAVIGFKRKKKPLAILATAMLLGAYGLAEIHRSRMATNNAIATDIVIDSANTSYDAVKHGKAVFDANCVVCHGQDGQLGLSGAKNLKISIKNESEIIDLLVAGKNTMPSYKKQLNETEMKALARYVLKMRE
jgi:uncharacterized membrane protein SirB2